MLPMFLNRLSDDGGDLMLSLSFDHLAQMLGAGQAA